MQGASKDLLKRSSLPLPSPLGVSAVISTQKLSSKALLYLVTSSHGSFTPLFALSFSVIRCPRYFFIMTKRSGLPVLSYKSSSRDFRPVVMPRLYSDRQKCWTQQHTLLLVIGHTNKVMHSLFEKCMIWPTTTENVNAETLGWDQVQAADVHLLRVMESKLWLGWGGAFHASRGTVCVCSWCPKPAVVSSPWDKPCSSLWRVQQIQYAAGDEG